jgi:hypothetical protein
MLFTRSQDAFQARRRPDYASNFARTGASQAITAYLVTCDVRGLHRVPLRLTAHGRSRRTWNKLHEESIKTKRHLLVTHTGVWACESILGVCRRVLFAGSSLSPLAVRL